MKPAVVLSMALILSACGIESKDTINPNASADVSDSLNQTSDKVRLDPVSLNHAWTNPFQLPISWQFTSNKQHTWTVLLDNQAIVRGDQSLSNTMLVANDLSDGMHILKLKLCMNQDDCIQSQPVLLNLNKVVEVDTDSDAPDVTNPDTVNPPNENNPQDALNEALDDVIQKYFQGGDPSEYLESDAIAFFDLNRQGNTRIIRNDLNGELQGMVQFVQSHSVNPNGNDQNNHPDVVAKRQSLLLFTPYGNTEQGFTVTAWLNDEELGTLTLSHPNLLPKSDYANSDGRPDVTYSKRAYHAVLPWNWMQPGLSLAFASESKQGTLLANNITFAAPAELVLHNIRLGMLAEPPVSDSHKLITEAVKYTTDYFQTIPVSKLINAHYQEMKLDKVILANGITYDQVSSDNGGVYSGDMRQNVAKEQVSTGINEANWGRSSTANRESNPQLTARITMHHAQGRYQNGVQAHGLSGGAGIGTLYGSTGNELSHELGHNYGLGHYPGRYGNDVFWAAHHADSGWGYIAHRNRMRANLHWNADSSGITVVDGIKSTEIFDDTYSYNKDAMSGGSVVSAYSEYTHHTGYSTNKIQHWLAPKWIADKAFSSGYKKWHEGQFIDANVGNQYRKPVKVGVPVVTLLGGYDPTLNQQHSVLYPAFVSNYGNVYDLNENTISSDQCGMDIRYSNGAIEKIALHGSRVQSGYINKFHVNLEASRQPEFAQIYCHQNGVKNMLASIDIPSQLPEIQAAVIVGEEHGFRQLEQLEVAQLQNVLLQFNSGKDVLLGHDMQSIVSAWPNPVSLSGSAKTILDEYKEYQYKRDIIQAWINKETSPASADVKALLVELGLDSTSLPEGGVIRSDRNNACLSLHSDNSVSVERGACDTDNQKWFMDGVGRIHSVAKPGMCLLTSNSKSEVQLCGNQPQFMWREDENRRMVSLSTNRCLDYTGAGEAILYGCHGYENQKWTIESVTDNANISQFSGGVLKHL